MLTRKIKGGNWHIQFRVPERLKDQHPFIGKVLFSRSTGTKNHAEAVALKEKFLLANGYHDDEQDRQEIAYVRSTKAEDHYWKELQSLQHYSDEELARYGPELDDIRFEYMNVDMDGTQDPNIPYVEMLTAKIKAVETTIRLRKLKPFESEQLIHPYKMSLSKICTEYERHQKSLKREDKTVAKIEAARKRFCDYSGSSDIEAERIKKSHVFGYINVKRAEGASKKTTQNDLTFLGGDFTHAQNSGVISSHFPNPFAGHQLKDFKKSIQREVFNEEQLKAICTESKKSSELIAYTYVGYYTGMRLAEIYDAKVIRVDGGLSFSVAEGGTGKTKAATRIIPLHTELVEALKLLGFPAVAGAPLSWKSSGAMAIGKRFGRAKEKVFEARGITDHSSWVFHSLRHGFSTALSNAGFSELHITDLTGHEKEGKAISEAGRTYIRSVPHSQLRQMIEAIPTIFSPDQIPGLNITNRQSSIP